MEARLAIHFYSQRESLDLVWLLPLCAFKTHKAKEDPVTFTGYEFNVQIYVHMLNELSNLFLDICSKVLKPFPLSWQPFKTSSHLAIS